jgi:hypothetical protein
VTAEGPGLTTNAVSEVETFLPKRTSASIETDHQPMFSWSREKQAGQTGKEDVPGQSVHRSSAGSFRKDGRVDNNLLRPIAGQGDVTRDEQKHISHS